MPVSQCFFCKNNPALAIEAKQPVCLDCLNLALKDYVSKTQRQKTSSAHSKDSTEVEEYVIGFGKNRGKKILEVEPDYIRWCLENFDGLRDVDVFNQALERLTGDRVETPAAQNPGSAGGSSRNAGNAPLKAFASAPKSAAVKDVNSAFDEASASEAEGDFPF